LKIAAFSLLDEQRRDQHGTLLPNLLFSDLPAAHAAGRLPAVAKRSALQRMASLIPLNRETPEASVFRPDGNIIRNDRDGNRAVLNRVEALRA